MFWESVNIMNHENVDNLINSFHFLKACTLFGGQILIGSKFQIFIRSFKHPLLKL